MILANGCPKSGTHALMAWLESLGLERCPGTVKPKHAAVEGAGDFVHAHVPFARRRAVQNSTAVVTVLRDPRDVLVSYMRWAPERPTLVEAIDSFLGSPFVPRYRSFLKWRGHCTVLCYEDIVAPAKGETYTGAPSNWRGWWSDEVADAWRRAGGEQLVADAGYEVGR